MARWWQQLLGVTTGAKRLAFRRLAAGSEPGGKRGVRHIHRGEVVAVHHVLELLERRVDEQRRVATAGAAPNDVRRRATVPGCRFGNDTYGFRGDDQVGADVVEALGLWGTCALLYGISSKSREQW